MNQFVSDKVLCCPVLEVVTQSGVVLAGVLETEDTEM